MDTLKYFILTILISQILAVRYVEKKDDSKDFDGVIVSLIYRPQDCHRTTQDGDLLKVKFNGTLADGSPFSTRNMNEPFEFVLGENQVIIGWEAGLQDMCQGETRQLTIPAKYAWGNGAVGGLPSRTTLYFNVHLISFDSVINAPRKANTFAEIDVNHDQLLSHDEVKQYLKTSGVKDVTGDHGLKQMLRDIFKEEDRDSNGFIEHQEFSGNKHDEL